MARLNGTIYTKSSSKTVAFPRAKHRLCTWTRFRQLALRIPPYYRKALPVLAGVTIDSGADRGPATKLGEAALTKVYCWFITFH